MTDPQHPADANNPGPAGPPQQPWANPGDQPPQQPWAAPGGQPYPAQPGGSTVPPQPNRKAIIISAAAIVGVLAVGTLGFVVWDGYLRKDSGVAACEAMRDGKSPDGRDKSPENKLVTEAQYRQLRKVFEDSRHDKIREHGTGLVDIGWQIEQLPEGQSSAALAFIGPMGTHLAGLQTACADQGVIVNITDQD
ncbi:hypothetical protein [Micromonospora sp. DT233]|uniref:hypothetical protein n=1 Tax=Micromonospora sp. DT233 TaxID=3393432 RepID=UPI003CF91B06